MSNQLHQPERMLSKSRVYALYMILNRLVNESHHPNEVENDACQNSSDSHLISKSTPKKILPLCERYYILRHKFSIVIPRPISIPDSLPCQPISVFIILSVYMLKTIGTKRTVVQTIINGITGSVPQRT